MLLSLNWISNEHCLLPTNEWTDEKTKSDFKTVSVNILPLLAKWLSQTFITDRICYQQCFQCFNKEVAVLSFTQISFKMWLSSWNEGAVYRFCGSTVSWWTGKGPELISGRHGSKMKMYVWGLNYNVQLQASAYDL